MGSGKYSTGNDWLGADISIKDVVGDRLEFQSDGNLTFYSDSKNYEKFWAHYGTVDEGIPSFVAKSIVTVAAMTPGMVIAAKLSVAKTVTGVQPGTVLAPGNNTTGLFFMELDQLNMVAVPGGYVPKMSYAPNKPLAGGAVAIAAILIPVGVHVLSEMSHKLLEYPRDTVAFSAGTNGNPGSKLAIQEDGNAVIYNSSGQAIWSTNTAGVPMNHGEFNDTITRGAQGVVFKNSPTCLFSLNGQRLYKGDSISTSFGALYLEKTGALNFYTKNNKGEVFLNWTSGVRAANVSYVELTRDSRILIYNDNNKIIHEVDIVSDLFHSVEQKGHLFIDQNGRVILQNQFFQPVTIPYKGIVPVKLGGKEEMINSLIKNRDKTLTQEIRENDAGNKAVGEGLNQKAQFHFNNARTISPIIEAYDEMINYIREDY